MSDLGMACLDTGKMLRRERAKIVFGSGTEAV